MPTSDMLVKFTYCITHTLLKPRIIKLKTKFTLKSNKIIRYIFYLACTFVVDPVILLLLFLVVWAGFTAHYLTKVLCIFSWHYYFPHCSLFMTCLHTLPLHFFFTVIFRMSWLKYLAEIHHPQIKSQHSHYSTSINLTNHSTSDNIGE
jgi:hypothetical protein